MKSIKISLKQFGYLPLIILFFSILNQNLNAQQLAFPSAKGAGAYASGGRGGQVIHVTTLDWDAPGGLLEAIQTPGPRIIVFDVSGEIDATEQWTFTPIIQGSAYDNITIAGQTAPEGGITIKVSEFMFQNVDNVIIRYVRFRQMINGTQDPMWFISTSNVILDHCTFSHGADEGMDLSASSGVMGDVTVQNCFFQDSKTGSILGIDDVDGDFTFINNAYSNISHRFPNPKGEGHYDIINNIVYNWKNRLIRITGGGTYNVINNYYKPAANGLRQPGWFGDGHISWLQKIQTQAHDNPLVYSSGSIVVGQRETPLDDDRDMWSNFAGSHLTVGAQSPSQYFTTSQFPIVGATYNIKTANEAYIDILNDVGANKTLNGNGTILQYVDSKDAADILMMQNDTYTGSFYVDRNTIPHPTIPHNTRPEGFDSNNDGMPDAWKLLKGFDVDADLSNYEWPSGYIGVEEYLNEIDDNPEEVVDITSIQVTPETATIYVSETFELGVTILPETATNLEGTWSSSDDAIASVDSNGLVTANYPGEVTITFTSYNGISATTEITVLPEALQASAGEDQQICEGESIMLTASGGTSYLWNTGETTESIEVTPNETTTYTVTVSDDFDQSEDANVTVIVNTIPTADAGENLTTCSGEPVTLTATGGTTFLWSTGETTASIEVSPEVETIYTVEVTENNCSSSTEVTVFIDELPNITVNEDIVIVEGESTILTASGSDNYEWSTSETSESITVSPLETTTYSVSTMGSNGCSNSVDVTVTVIPEIVAYAGEDLTVCSGDTVNLIASGGNTYVWDTGDVGSELIVNPTTTTTYTVTAEDAYGYTNTDSVTVFVNELPNITAGENVFVMLGNSATLNANGGINYTWSTGETTAEITVSPEVTTTYTVTGDSENGCQNIAEITVTVVEVLAANAGEDIDICIGDSVTLNASGGTGYTWNTGDVGAFPTFAPTETTTYTVTVTDDYGNSDTDEVTVTVNPIPVAYAGEDLTTCQNEPVTLTATAVDGDSYLWSTGETTESITVNPNEDTVYTVEVFNDVCSHSDDVTVFVLPIPELTLTEDIVIITGNSTTLEVEGGDSYLWSTDETTESITVSPTETTTYTVNAFLENGCETTAEVTVTVVPQVFADAGEDVAICIGESITLTATGSTNFSWSTGGTNASITVSPSETTTYTVIVSDDYGHSETDSVTITVNELPNIIVSENITIFEGETADLTVNGAETYLWSTEETTNTISVNPTEQTTYSVTGFSLYGCETIANITVTVIPQVIADAGNDVEICVGESVNLIASGSTYFSWSTGATNESIVVSPSETTTFTVTVSDDFGNTDTDSVTITVNELPTLTISEDITIIEGESIDLSVNGAETYLWSTGDTMSAISVSPNETTTYTVTGFSVNGCQEITEVTVSVIPEVIADAGNDLSICNGNSVTITATGGSNYFWSNGETGNSITLSPTETTTLSVTVSDNYGNSDTDSVTITVNELPNITVSDDVVIFEGDSATLTANGGVNYLWNTNETTSSIIVSPIETTTYLVNGFSSNSCHTLKEITVTVIPEINANAGIDRTICYGDSVTLTATGGTNFVWNTGQSTASIVVSPTETTTYTVNVMDDYGNMDSDTVNVNVTEIPNISVSENLIIMEGESANLSVNGANVYLWSTGQSNNTIVVSPLTTTTYSVRGFTLNSCESEELQVTVTVIPQVGANAGSDVAICNGESTTLIASGGSTYLWNTGQTTASYTVAPTETTTYTVTVTDNYGNSDSDSVTVTVDEIPTLNVSDNITIFEGESTELIAEGASTYLWNTGETNNSIVVSPISTTTYSVNGFSANGCESEVVQVTITVLPAVIANAGNDVTICSGESVTLNASGGANYVWNTGGTGASPTFTPTETTTYTVTVSDNLGNSDTDSVTVTVDEIPTLNVSDNITIFEGESTELTAEGASTYLWNTGETTNSIVVSPTSTTTYSVNGFSANGCESEGTEVTVTVIPAVIANAGNDITICIGETVTLSASGGDNYSWNTGQNNATITLTPTETTTYTVTVSDNLGNSDTDSVTVIVNELPIVTVSENITIIEGESTSLTANGAESYMWSTGEALSSITVSPTQTTTYTVAGTTNSCAAQAEVTVTVTPLFVASAGADEHVCDNLSYEVELTANEGDSYLWSTGETTQSIIVSPFSTTSYSVSVTQGQQVDNDDVTVYVNPSPDVVILNGDSVDILNGDFVTLTASGANNYEWSNGALQPNIAVSPTVTTVYEVKGFIGDCYDEKQIVVNVIDPVIADAGDDVLICIEETTVLTATGGDEYLWSTGETTATIEVTPSVTTDYTVTVFNALDFDEATVTVEVDSNCAEQIPDPTDEDSSFAFDVYPNPANNVINVKLSGSILVSDIYIFDVTGKLIQQTRISNESIDVSSTTQIDISSLNPGVYFVKLSDLEKDVTKKLIVK